MSNYQPNTVLLVDDSWYMQSLVQDLLEAAGYRIAHANDGAEAIQIYQGQRPDVVLMDIVLPGADGFHAIAQIQDIDPQAQIVVVTGLADEAARRQALGAGAAEFIAKPFHSDQLLRAVQAALTRRSLLAQELQAPN